MENKEYRPTILVVDDDSTIYDIICNMFQADFHVIYAENGLEGLKTISQVIPNLIILDIVMPKVNGIEFCRKLKDDASFKNIPVIFLSNVTSLDDVHKALNFSPAAYINKPISTQHVEKIVRDIMFLSDH